jgi:hypothetical protein
MRACGERKTCVTRRSGIGIEGERKAGATSESGGERDGKRAAEGAGYIVLGLIEMDFAAFLFL